MIYFTSNSPKQTKHFTRDLYHILSITLVLFYINTEFEISHHVTAIGGSERGELLSGTTI